MESSPNGQESVSDKSMLFARPNFYLIGKIDSGKFFSLITQECLVLVGKRYCTQFEKWRRNGAPNAHVHSRT